MATPSTNTEQAGDPARLTRQWLEQVVLGLGLCPFATRPTEEDRVRIQVTEASEPVPLLHDLHHELSLLEQTDPSHLETTLLVIPRMLTDFDAFNQFLDRVDALLKEFHWRGVFQVASFHPHYCFAEVDPQAAENLTNRAPFPIFHLIREHSLSSALANTQRPEDIPQRNIQQMNLLSEAQVRTLFPWLFSD